MTHKSTFFAFISILAMALTPLPGEAAGPHSRGRFLGETSVSRSGTGCQRVVPVDGEFEPPIEDPAYLLDEKGVLSYLLLQPSRFVELHGLPILSENIRTLGRLAVYERRALLELRGESDKAMIPGSLLRTAEIDEAEVASFNRESRRVLERSRRDVEALLSGEERAIFYRWIGKTWHEERERVHREKPTLDGGRGLTYTVFATQYFGETNYEVAIPDKYIKFANREWEHYQGYPDSDYSLKLERSGYTISSVLVWDVGPWNIDDNYWNPASGHPRPRRLFTDLPQGMPEAQAAYYDGYNNGKDQFGRDVTIPTALDLSPAVAADIGLGYLENDWVTVTFLWEDEGGTQITIDDSSPRCKFRGPPEYWWEVSGYGQNGQMHYTYNISSGWENAAGWVFSIPQAGNYDVSVFIPRNHATTESANYHIRKKGAGWIGPYIINQNIYYDQWVSIGTHYLPRGQNIVAVIDGTGEPPSTKKIGVDAVRATLQ